jgi:hypothetical protein
MSAYFDVGESSLSAPPRRASAIRSIKPFWKFCGAVGKEEEEARTQASVSEGL